MKQPLRLFKPYKLIRLCACVTFVLFNFTTVGAGEATIQSSKEQAHKAVLSVMQKYIDGTKKGDVELLKTIFHPKAQMVGYMGPDLLTGGPEPFFQALLSNPPDDGFRAAYKSHIRDMEVNGTVAKVTLDERGFYNSNFINHFHLLNDNGTWLITSKLFQVSN